MQIKNNRSNYLQNPWIIGVIKLVLLICCLSFIIFKLKEQSINFTETTLPDSFGSTVGLVLLLMFLNWYLEALRWKISLQPFEPISIKKACKVILGGLALNWILPFTTGDLVVRLAQQQDKFQATSAALLNRGIMLCITILLGMYGMSKLVMQYDINGWFALLLLFSYPLVRWLLRKSLDRFLSYFRNLDRITLLKIVGLSLLRYTVFVFQFYLLFKVFLPMLSADLLLAGVGWVFFIRSVLPLFFGGVGVREASGILFFEPHVSNLQLVLLPIFLIWVINTVVPSLAGMISIWRMKQLTSD